MCHRATLPAPASAVQVSWRNWARTFPGRPEQVRVARTLLAGFLEGFPAADEALLLASELATNAISHSASGQPDGSFTIRARLSGVWLRVEVEDQGSAWNGRLVPAEAPHGLYLLRALSAACGTLNGAGGWLTWFTLAG